MFKFTGTSTNTCTHPVFTQRFKFDLQLLGWVVTLKKRGDYCCCCHCCFMISVSSDLIVNSKLWLAYLGIFVFKSLSDLVDILSFSSGIFIDDWTNACVCLVYKGNNSCDMGNYRPISILPILSKVLEKEVFQQLYHYVKVNSILSKFQSGFCFKCAVIDLIIWIEENWQVSFCLIFVRPLTQLIIRFY